MTQQQNQGAGSEPETGANPDERSQGGGASGPNHSEFGDTRRTDQNGQHKSGADGTGGPGGSGGSVL